MELELDGKALRHGRGDRRSRDDPPPGDDTADGHGAKEREARLGLGAEGVGMARAEEPRPGGAAADDLHRRPGDEALADNTAVERLDRRERRRPAHRRLTATAAARGRDAADERLEGGRARRSAGVERREDDRAAGGHAGRDGGAVLAADRDVDRPIRDARVDAGDDVAAQRAAHLPHGGRRGAARRRGDHDPGAGDRQARLQALALVGGAGPTGARQGGESRRDRDRPRSQAHRTLRNQSEESALPTSISTAPPAANAEVTSTRLRSRASRVPSSR